jgi:hypothetical protein
VLLLAGIYWAARQRWWAAPELREQREYTFAGDGIRVIGESFTAFVTWSNIASAERAGRQVLLGTHQDQFYLIPLAAFGTDEELSRFCKLVATKVEGCRL